MKRRAFNIHESFAGNLAYKDSILWDAYTPRQFFLFKQKINELFRDPEPTPTNQLGATPQNEPGATPQNERGATPQNEPGATPQNEPGATPQNEPGASPQNEPGGTSQNEVRATASETSESSSGTGTSQNEAGGTASANSSASGNSNETQNSTPSKLIEKIRKAVYYSTIAQTKYTNKNLLATFILVTVAEGTTYIQARDATKFSVHLIVRTRKCMKMDDSTDCCMTFIDEQGNVYKNWNHFMETNCLPEGVALAPQNGVYKFENGNENTNGKLVLDSWVTPSSSVACKAAATADVVAGIGGLAAASGTLAALALPVIVPALPVLGVVCAGTGAYSAIRSGWSLWSRKDHEQSISLTDSSARGAWLGVASGALAVSSSIANKSLAQLAMAGKEVSLVREVVVNGMNISTMLLSGTGVANGILDLLLKYSDDEKIGGLDVLQVAASLAIFTHSAYNFRLASTIVAQTRDSTVSTYRTELSNRQRKMFDKLYKETLRTQGASKGKMDVIRLINEVPDKQYLNDMNKINKNLNKNNIRISAGQNGQISLNDEIQVRSGDLRNNVQHGIGENILGKVTQPIPNSHETIPNQETLNILTQNAFNENINTLINYCQTAIQIASPLILNGEAFQDCVQNLILTVGEKIAFFLIQKSNEFITIYGRIIENFLKTKLHLEDVIWHLYRKCEETLLTFTIEVLQKNMQSIFEQLISFYEEMSYENRTAERIECKVCQGFYQICSIDPNVLN